MLLTVSKRIEFSASRRLFSERYSLEENRRRFGEESAARYGSGRNYVAYFVFAGEPDPVTGMLINISEIKQRAGEIINDRYDHRFLNADNPSFAEVPPTVANVAKQLLADVAPLFRENRAQLTAVHVRESPERTATAYASGAVESNFWFEFSAARQTMSPHLSARENEQLFGESVREHGHNYRARLTAPADTNFAQNEVDRLLRSFHAELDHKFLNRDVPSLRDQPVTTESLVRHILSKSAAEVGVCRVRLHEREDFFAEATRDGEIFLGMRESFGAAHRLHVPSFSDQKNAELFGKCNNPRGHGHYYISEATIRGEYDERSGAAGNFVAMRDAISGAIADWRDKHLDLEAHEFDGHPSTGENIVAALWPKLDARLEHRLTRLRLWETQNNRFTLRRVGE